MRSSAEKDEATTSVIILNLLLGEDEQCVWSAEEVAREVGDPVAVRDALAELAGAGLVHRLGEFVFVSRAAKQAADRLVA